MQPSHYILYFHLLHLLQLLNCCLFWILLCWPANSLDRDKVELWCVHSLLECFQLYLLVFQVEHVESVIWNLQVWVRLLSKLYYIIVTHFALEKPLQFYVWTCILPSIYLEVLSKMLKTLFLIKKLLNSPYTSIFNLLWSFLLCVFTLILHLLLHLIQLGPLSFKLIALELLRGVNAHLVVLLLLHLLNIINLNLISIQQYSFLFIGWSIWKLKISAG